MPSSPTVAEPAPTADENDADANANHWRAATRWSVASVAWTAGSSATSIAAGVATGTLLLVVFGAVGLMDLAGSVVLTAQFRHALRHESMSTTRERRALFVIAAGLATIAAVTVVVSCVHLVQHDSPRFSALGSSVAAASIVALSILATGKRNVAASVGSRALLADSHLSAVGALFATFTLGGTFAATRLGW
jgi:divalent metal cation (Fe/Co/Zn/Cd) transporter